MLLHRGVGSTSREPFDFAIQKVVQYDYARSCEVRLFSQADFLSVAEHESLYFFGQANMVAKHENAVLGHLGFGYVFSAFFENIDARVFCFSL